MTLCEEFYIAIEEAKKKGMVLVASLLQAQLDKTPIDELEKESFFTIAKKQENYL